MNLKIGILDLIKGIVTNEKDSPNKTNTSNKAS